MLSRLIAPAALLLAASATAATESASTPSKQNPQVSKSTGAKAKAAPAKPKPPAHDPKAARILDIAGLGEVTVYAPQGEVRGLALFASGDGAWNLGVWDMAHTAADLGYWVVGFSTPAFLKTLESDDGACSDAAGLLDRLGDTVKKQMKLPAKFHPALIGYSSGATIAYAALAQSGDARFSGAMTLGFCPDLIIHKPFCAGAGLTAEKQKKPPYGIVFNTVPAVPAPWIVLQGEIDQVCNPPDTMAFVDKVKNGKVVSLPHVGHGFGVPRNWMPQYRQGLIELLDGKRAAARREAGGASALD
jgi:type IV secretory pathway VirJ component